MTDNIYLVVDQFNNGSVYEYEPLKTASMRWEQRVISMHADPPIHNIAATCTMPHVTADDIITSTIVSCECLLVLEL